MKKTYIGQLQQGQRFSELFLCQRKSLGSDRNGNPFLSLTLSDRTGQLDALLWKRADRADAAVEQGHVVRAEGLVNLYRGKLQLHLDGLSPAKPGDPTDDELFLPRAATPADELLASLDLELDALDDPELARLARALLADEELRRRLMRAPAAKSVHHARLGGLVEHTLSVVRLAKTVCDHYAQAQPGLLNRDLCLVGALVHDLGKVDEMSDEGGTHYTDDGRLLGHMVLGMRRLDRVLEQLEPFDPVKARLVRHLLISHHGTLEHGSPRRPKTAEAMVVHWADKLDSQLDQVAMVKERTAGQPWSSYDRGFDRYLYFGPSKDVDGEEAT